MTMSGSYKQPPNLEGYINPMDQTLDEYRERLRKFFDTWPKDKPLPPIELYYNNVILDWSEKK
jgi:hypothetical protein